ncbi:ATP-dependent DNA helicase RecG [Demetria terragena]|uniref:ATP-dependent DNA helicase RecG n=1 Tax=Demetria terragena TaxID=63959 RepID=UPI00036767AC|nr:ATP-dependent DNA helicase RecG [Demetria terragena]
MAGITKATPLDRVLGAAAKKLSKHRGLETVGDLLDFLPRRYVDARRMGELAEFSRGEHVVLVANVVSATTRPMRQRRGKMLEAVVEDGQGERVSLVFFSAYGHETRLRPGVRALCRGELQTYRQSWQLAHPDYVLLDDEDEGDVYRDGLVPLYKTVKQVSDLNLTKAMRLIFEQLDLGPDPVPQELREQHDLVTQAEAYRMLHLPADLAEVERARHRLRYDEALVVQTVLAQRRAKSRSEQSTPRLATPGGLLAAFDEQLPFVLTAGQKVVAEEIAADMAGEHPMHRLLQGEVGSGKTVVALRAMLAAIDSGAQAALLAPTEVLAQQHERSIRALLGSLGQRGMLGGDDRGTQVALLTGSMTKKQREKVLLDIVTGPVGIVVGTHALIEKNVMFADLGLVVVDEQHRFGVEQRDALRDKAIRAPHLLVMTATPIPRTVAMTTFGDMDTSTLSELPKGRQPIATHVVPALDRPAWLTRAWEKVAEEVAEGHQAYVVCPRIGDEPVDDPELTALERMWNAADSEGDEPEDEAPLRPMRGVLEVLDDLRQRPELRGLRVEMLHGRLPAEEKDAVMAAFTRGEIDVLVATTVIEVGVDVPNATVMVLMDADRFGISQLHQLRGRVGRGEGGGLCLLVTESENEASLDRLHRVAATTDGFALADLDLELRREGDVLGASQSGRRSQLRLLRLTHREDIALIEQARTDATDLVTKDASLMSWPGLEAMVGERLDETQAAFLERG